MPLINITDAPEQLALFLEHIGVLHDEAAMQRVVIRVVAPGSYFLQHRVVDAEFMHHLKAAASRAPLHVSATLGELQRLQHHFASVTIVAASDSAFHVTKPDYAWNYGIDLDDADKFDIKRFGYHGLSAASVIDILKHREKLPPKVIMCHIGGGVSVTAVYKGKSIDTTMGYSPLEGVIMATRSGSIDPIAARELQQKLGLDAAGMENYLNCYGGLQGLSGVSSSVLDLLKHEEAGNHRASLALDTYVFALQKAIGQMASVLNGVDVLVFTGTVGERSAPIRERVVSKLTYLDFALDKRENNACFQPASLAVISKLVHSKPIFVAPANEERQMVIAASTV
jgi:acetate kinase